MNVKTFEKLIKTENSARLYFRKKCYKKTRIFYTRCMSTKSIESQAKNTVVSNVNIRSMILLTDG
jgi:hypothetical protein